MCRIGTAFLESPRPVLGFGVLVANREGLGYGYIERFGESCAIGQVSRRDGRGLTEMRWSGENQSDVENLSRTCVLREII